MDLNKLHFFKVTAELEHMTKAAELLGTNQPFLSKSIRSLEQELNAPLFIRSGQGISLSPFGKTYYKYVKALFDSLEDGARAVRDMQDQLSRTVRIGTNACSFLPSFFASVRTRMPDLVIRQRTNALDALLKELENGAFDFVFAVSPKPLNTRESLSARLLTEDSIKLLLPRSHPLAGHSSLELEEIAAQPLIAAPYGYGMTDCLLHPLRENHMAPNIVVETTDIAIIPKYVAGGLGISAFPSCIAETINLEEIVRIIPREASFHAYFYLLWNNKRYASRSSELFLQLAMDHYR